MREMYAQNTWNPESHIKFARGGNCHLTTPAFLPQTQRLGSKFSRAFCFPVFTSLLYITRHCDISVAGLGCVPCPPTPPADRQGEPEGGVLRGEHCSCNTTVILSCLCLPLLFTVIASVLTNLSGNDVAIVGTHALRPAERGHARPGALPT